MHAHTVFDKESENMTKAIVWNLDDLYQGEDDPRLDQDLEAVRERAQAFVSLYKGKISREDLEAQNLLEAIEAYESIHDLGMKPYAFAYLYHVSDVRDPKRNALFQSVREAWNEILEMITFFPLEIMALPESAFKRLAKHNALQSYRHFLTQQIKKLIGDGIEIVDTGLAVATQLKRKLEENDLLSSSTSEGKERFWSSGPLDEMNKLLKRLWGPAADLAPLPDQANFS